MDRARMNSSNSIDPSCKRSVVGEERGKQKRKKEKKKRKKRKKERKKERQIKAILQSNQKRTVASTATSLPWRPERRHCRECAMNTALNRQGQVAIELEWLNQRVATEFLVACCNKSKEGRWPTRPGHQYQNRTRPRKWISPNLLQGTKKWSTNELTVDECNKKDHVARRVQTCPRWLR